MPSLDDDLAMALDPVRMARAVGLEPDPWQAGVLRGQAQRLLLLCSRQAGKSTTAALLALHTAIYTPGTLVLLLSPSLRQSSELFRRVLSFYRQLEGAPECEAESTLRLELANGSRVVSLPGNEQTIRGFSGVSLLVIDEAARVPDDLYYAVRPMLAVSRGRLVAMTTPFGKRGFFFREWTEGGEAWKRIRVVAEECPRINAEFLAEERRALGDWWYRQEYQCEFVETQDQVFGYDLVMRAISSEVEPLFGGGV